MCTSIQLLCIIIIVLNVASEIESAKILAVFPEPSISHQVAFRPLVQELVKRGHQLVVITPEPNFPVGQTPSNLTEIDVHDVSYNLWEDNFSNTNFAEFKTFYSQWKLVLHINKLILETQLKLTEVRKAIESDDYDLLLIEATSRPSIGLTYKFKIPVIQVSSFLKLMEEHHSIGAPVHPILYPGVTRSKINNITSWYEFKELCNDILVNHLYATTEKADMEMWKQFHEDIPTLSELRNNVHMVFLNSYPIFDNYQPVPPGVVYFGGSRDTVLKGLPSDLKYFMDSSVHGVIYLSFGSNVMPSKLPPEVIQIFVNALSRLPYDVLMKWDKDELPGRSQNIKILKWFPQIDVLGHRNLKLFITQAGLQSTYEAIAMGVPLVCVPIMFDQFLNTEKYVQFGIGERLDIDTITESSVVDTINQVIKDERYRQNMIKIRSFLQDQPQRPLERAIWWTEYVLRHGAHHLRAPAANMPWTEYFEVELMIILLGFALFAIILIYAFFYILIKILKYYVCKIMITIKVLTQYFQYSN